MFPDSLLLIGTNLQGPVLKQVQETLAGWVGDDCPPVLTTTLQQMMVDSSLMKKAQVGWIVIDRAEGAGESAAGVKQTDVFEVIAMLQDRRIPVLLTRVEDAGAVDVGAAIQPDVLAMPVGTGADVGLAVLRSVWNQAQSLQELLMEMRLLKAQQASMEGQMTRIDEELRLAAKLQREFLPMKLPTFAGVKITHLYRPAGYVSGDVFDVVKLDENHVGLFIADAVGHGVPAAMMTIHIKQSLHLKKAEEPGDEKCCWISPSQVLQSLNRNMMELQGSRVRTATAFYGILDVSTSRFRYARAGHPMPFLMRREGSIEALQGDGALLGVFPEEPFEEQEIELRPGDRLIIYSDGFETAFQQNGGNRTDLTGLANDQYRQEFLDLMQGSIEESMQRLTKRLDEQTGSLNQVDDLTVVYVGMEAGTMQMPKEGMGGSSVTASAA